MSLSNKLDCDDENSDANEVKAVYGVTYTLQCPVCFKDLGKRYRNKRICPHCGVGFHAPLLII